MAVRESTDGGYRRRAHVRLGTRDLRCSGRRVAWPNNRQLRATDERAQTDGAPLEVSGGDTGSQWEPPAANWTSLRIGTFRRRRFRITVRRWRLARSNLREPFRFPIQLRLNLLHSLSCHRCSHFQPSIRTEILSPPRLAAPIAATGRVMDAICR